MARIDVYRITGLMGLGMDVQQDHLGELSTRLVVPLLPLQDFAGAMARLNPGIGVDGTDFVLKTEFATAVNVRQFGQPIGNIAVEHDRIIAAMDMLVTGI